MKRLLEKYFRAVAVAALLGGIICGTPAALQAKTNSDVSVDVVVNVHGSDINVSTDVMEESVEKLLEAAAIKVVDTGAAKGTVVLQIDIYKDDDDDDDDGVKDKDDEGDDGDGKGFIVKCDWDDDPEPEETKEAATQDAIDEIVEGIVDDFIEFIK